MRGSPLRRDGDHNRRGGGRERFAAAFTRMGPTALSPVAPACRIAPMRAGGCCTSAVTRRLLAALAIVVGLVPAAWAEPSLSADLSAHYVTLGANAAGRAVTLFGTVDAPGDIVIVVRGPETAVVAQHGPVGNFPARRIVFAGVPDYYAVYASAALDTIMPPEIQALHQIGLDNLHFQVQPPPPDATLVEAARLALIAQRQTTGVYASTIGTVGFVNPHLFRAT
ncbi:MAG TPA: TIGR02186 family protein, partial [Stellaceae bacterium]|nr:TIGR02186 family protein [Stellaceae bacterium]